MKKLYKEYLAIQRVGFAGTFKDYRDYVKNYGKDNAERYPDVPMVYPKRYNVKATSTEAGKGATPSELPYFIPNEDDLPF